MSPFLRSQRFLCPKLDSSGSSLLCNSTNAFYKVRRNRLYHLILHLESYFRASSSPSESIVGIELLFLRDAFALAVLSEKHGTVSCTWCT
jgi:hypothetical protein